MDGASNPRGSVPLNFSLERCRTLRLPPVVCTCGLDVQETHLQPTKPPCLRGWDEERIEGVFSLPSMGVSSRTVVVTVSTSPRPPRTSSHHRHETRAKRTKLRMQSATKNGRSWNGVYRGNTMRSAMTCAKKATQSYWSMVWNRYPVTRDLVTYVRPSASKCFFYSAEDRTEKEKNRKNALRTNASAGYATGGGEELEQVAWSPELKNRINLIGRAGDKPDIRYLDSGKVVARIGLAVDRPNRNDPDWFDVEVWDTLAEVVANQVGKGQQIAIGGFLKMDAWTDRNSGAKRRVVKVVATDVKNVLPYEGQSQGSGNRGGYGGRGGGGGVNVEATWSELFANPDQFWDNRRSKRNPRAPDFKHKDTGVALWIDSRQTPDWVPASLDKLDETRDGGQTGGGTDGRYQNPSGSAAADYDVPF